MIFYSVCLNLITYICIYIQQSVYCRHKVYFCMCCCRLFVYNQCISECCAFAYVVSCFHCKNLYQLKGVGCCCFSYGYSLFLFVSVFCVCKREGMQMIFRRFAWALLCSQMLMFSCERNSFLTQLI